MVDFEVYQGDVFRWPMQSLVDGEDEDITGYKYYMTIKLDKDTEDDSEAAIKKEFDPTTPLEGRTIILLTPAETATLAVSTSTTRYSYDIREKSDTGEPEVLLEGVFTVLQPVTREVSV